MGLCSSLVLEPVSIDSGIFDVFLRQIFVHPQHYTSLYISGNLLQDVVHRLSTQGFSMLFWGVLRQVLIHHPVHLGLYHQTQGLLVLF